MTIYEKIATLQAGKMDTPAWTVGEQLKDICRREPDCIPILEADLENEAMSLEAAAGKIKEYADKNHGKAKCFCVTPIVAEGILREFYGLPGVTDKTEEPPPDNPKDNILDLSDFL